MTASPTVPAGRARALVALLALTACRPDGPQSAAPIFAERAAPAGVDFRHRSGADGRFLFPEIMGSGVCLLDYDGDGLLDLYFVQSGTIGEPESAEPNRLYRNLGGLAFRETTRRAGVGDRGYGMGCATGDYDGDGWTDLHVTNLGPNVLYRNRGDGGFEEVSARTGTDDPGWSTSSAFADFDRDGRLDLAVVNYLEWEPAREIECHRAGRRDYCSPNNYNAPAMDVLYLGRGERFEEATLAAGLAAAFGNGLGVVAADLDGDGDQDLFVANDGMENQLWINSGDARFRDEAIVRGTALNATGGAEAGMGVAAGDPDGDGDLDLFLSHLDDETNTFYRNQGGAFADRTARLGLAAASLGRTGFGTGFADLDNDGLLDLYVANGRVTLAPAIPPSGDPYAEPNQLFLGSKDGGFEEAPRAGMPEELVATSRGAAFGDLDNDGAVDVVVANRDGAPHLLHNAARDAGSWLLLRIEDAGRDALGARTRVEAGSRRWWRWVATGSSYCSANDARVHVGLGAAPQIDRIVVEWPGGGRTEILGPLPPRRIYNVAHGDGGTPPRQPRLDPSGG